MAKQVQRHCRFTAGGRLTKVAEVQQVVVPALDAVDHPAQRQKQSHLNAVHPVEGTRAPAQVVRVQPAHTIQANASETWRPRMSALFLRYGVVCVGSGLVRFNHECLRCAEYYRRL